MLLRRDLSEQGISCCSLVKCLFIGLKKAASAIKLPVGNQMWVFFELYA